MIEFKAMPSKTHNYLLNKSNDDAAYRQSLDEHEETINKYVVPGMNPQEKELAIQMGMLEEMNLPRYWDDTYPRRDLGLSSSWVRSLKLEPNSNVAIVNDKYILPMTTDEAGDILTSESIGDKISKKIRGK